MGFLLNSSGLNASLLILGVEWAVFLGLVVLVVWGLRKSKVRQRWKVPAAACAVLVAVAIQNLGFRFIPAGTSDPCSYRASLAMAGIARVEAELMISPYRAADARKYLRTVRMDLDFLWDHCGDTVHVYDKTYTLRFLEDEYRRAQRLLAR